MCCKDIQIAAGASWQSCSIGTEPELIRPAGPELSFCNWVSLYHDLQSVLEYPYGLFALLLSGAPQPCLSQVTRRDPVSPYDHEISFDFSSAEAGAGG